VTIKIRIGTSLVSISANSYWNKPSRDQHDINSIRVYTGKIK